MGDHDRFGLRAKGRFQLVDVDFVARKLHVNEDGNSAILDQWGDGGREAAGNGNDFVASLDLPFFQGGRGQGHKSQEVRAGPRGSRQAEAGTKELREILLERLHIAAGGKPEIQRAIDQVHHFLLVVNPGSIMNIVAFFVRLFICTIIQFLKHHLFVFV